MYNYDGTNFRGVTRIEGERRGGAHLCVHDFEIFYHVMYKCTL